RLALGDRDALPRRRDPRAGGARPASRIPRRAPGAAARLAARLLRGVGFRADRLAHGLAAAGAYRDGARARARDRAGTAVPEHPRRFRPARSEALARGPERRPAGARDRRGRRRGRPPRAGVTAPAPPPLRG